MIFVCLLRELYFRIEDRAFSARIRVTWNGGFLERTCLETKGYRNQQNETYMASRLFAGISSDIRERQISCMYLQNNHSSYKCNIITDSRAVKAILRSKAKYFVCLKSGNRAIDFNSRVTCFKFKQPHHISICVESISWNNGYYRGRPQILKSLVTLLKWTDEKQWWYLGNYLVNINNVIW